MSHKSCIEELIKTIPFPSLVLDENNKVILKNISLGSAYDWGDEAPIGKTLFDLFSADQASLLQDACQNAADMKRPVTQKIILKGRWGNHEATAKMIPFITTGASSWHMILVIENKDTNQNELTPVDAAAESKEIDRPGISDVEAKVEEARAALRFLLSEGSEQLVKIKEDTLKNMASQCIPYIQGLKRTKLDKKQLEYTNLLESAIRRLLEPFTRKISDPMLKLSPMEIKIASLVRGGKTNKEMVKLLNLSLSTILTHRHHLRVKLGLRNKKQNLRSSLFTLGDHLDIGN